MDIIRRNTDYALRLMVNLAERYGKGVVSSKTLAEEEGVTYFLTCKLLQKLNDAGLVRSEMGPKGGFCLHMPPSEISLAMIIDTIQGPISLNSCLLGVNVCPNQPTCPISKKLSELQSHIDNFLKKITLEDLLKARKNKTQTNTKNFKKSKVFKAENAKRI